MQGTQNEIGKVALPGKTGFQILLKLFKRFGTPNGKGGISDFKNIFLDLMKGEEMKKHRPEVALADDPDFKKATNQYIKALFSLKSSNEMMCQDEVNRDLFSLFQVWHESSEMGQGEKMGERIEEPVWLVDPKVLSLISDLMPCAGQGEKNERAVKEDVLGRVTIKETPKSVFELISKQTTFSLGRGDFANRVDHYDFNVLESAKNDAHRSTVTCAVTAEKEAFRPVLEIVVPKRAPLVKEVKEEKIKLVFEGRQERVWSVDNAGGLKFSFPLLISEKIGLTSLEIEEKPEAIRVRLHFDEQGTEPQRAEKVTQQVTSFKDLKDTLKFYLTARGLDEEVAENVVGQIKTVVYRSLPHDELGENPLPEGEMKKVQTREEFSSFVERKGEQAPAPTKVKSSDRIITFEKVAVNDVRAVTRIRGKAASDSTNQPLISGEQGARLWEVKDQGEVMHAPLPVNQEEIIAQVTKTIESYGDRSGRMQLVLEPPHLGEVEMEIIVRGDRVRAVIASENDQVRQVLKNHVEEIKQVLTDQGLKVERLEVKAPEEGRQLPHWAGNGRDEREFYRDQRGKTSGEVKNEKENFASYLTTIV